MPINALAWTKHGSLLPTTVRVATENVDKPHIVLWHKHEHTPKAKEREALEMDFDAARKMAREILALVGND
jgi:hypothetical protein